MMTADRPQSISLLVCALGGEGGGVLARWLVDTAVAAGHAAQSTSIPGVAQRTGATTYYIEVDASPSVPGNIRPLFSLYPVPGALDLLASSELLETVRQIGAGFATREHTHVLSSTHRTLTTAEKMQLGDGRAPSPRLLEVVRAHSVRTHVFDMAALAREAGTAISAVMLGAIAASGVLPFAREHYEATIRRGGKGVEASLRGFELGLDEVRGLRTRVAVPSVPLAALPPTAEIAARFPAATLDIIAAGLARLREYQDEEYARLYLRRLERIRDAEAHVDPGGANGSIATREAARSLALWMAFDDVVRVADLKSRACPARGRRRPGRLAAPLRLLEAGHRRNRRLAAAWHGGALAAMGAAPGCGRPFAAGVCDHAGKPSRAQPGTVARAGFDEGPAPARQSFRAGAGNDRALA